MKVNKRAIALLCSLVVLMTAAVGATVAYLVDKSDKVENTFTPSYVACAVAQDAEGNYFVENTGDTIAYIRVAVVVTQKNGDTISAIKPEYMVTPGTNWVQGKDGYYYYRNPLNAKDITASCLAVTGNAAEGYTLSVEVIASAIQATTSAVAEWSTCATASENGGVLTVTTP